MSFSQLAIVYQCNHSTVTRNAQRMGLYVAPKKIKKKETKPAVKTVWFGGNPFDQPIIKL